MPLPSRPYLPEPVNLNHPLARGLVSWWLALPGIDQGNALYDLAGSNHGNLNGGLSWNNSQKGSCLSFNGTSGYVDCGSASSLSITNTLTLACWAMSTNTGTASNQYLISKTNGGSDSYGQAFFGTSVKSYLINTSGSAHIITTPASLANNVWYHFVTTFDGTTICQYLNGLLISSTLSGATGIKVSASSVAIGRLGGYPASFFSGRIDAPLIYNRGLSASEVFGLYNNSLLGYPGLLNQTKTTTKFFPYNEVMSGGGNLAGSAVVQVAYNELTQQTFLSVRSKKLYTPAPVNLNHPLARGLVGWWLALPGWMGGQKWYDLIGLNHGTLTSMGNTSNGWQNTTRLGGFGAMLFDGTAGYVNCGVTQFAVGTNQISFGCWAKVANTSNRYILMGQNNGASGGSGFVLQTANANILYDAGPTFTAPQVAGVVAGQWAHWFVTYDGANVRVYKNGSLIGTTARTGNLPTNTNKLEFGAQTDVVGFERYLPGSLDDLRIYTRAISGVEVFDLYNNSRLGYPGLLSQRYSGLTLSYYPPVPFPGASLAGSAVVQQIQNPPISSAGVLGSSSSNPVVTYTPNLVSTGLAVAGATIIVGTYNIGVTAAGAVAAGAGVVGRTFNIGITAAGVLAAGGGGAAVVYAPALTPAGVLINGSAGVVYIQNTPFLTGTFAITHALAGSGAITHQLLGEFSIAA